MVSRVLSIGLTVAILAPPVYGQRVGWYRSDQTLTSNPRAYAAYIRHETLEDLVELYEATNEMLAAVNERDPKALERVAKHPDRVVKRSRSLWGNVQYRRPTKERQKPPTALVARSLSEARKDLESCRALIRSIARVVNTMYRSREVDVQLTLETIEKIECVERFGYQLRADLAEYR